MGGLRVLVSGMGGELGSRVASLLEDEPWVGSLEGIDVDPPRRRLRRAVFHRIVAGQHDRIVAEITRFDPHVLVHVAVWEPHARAHPATARRLTDDAAISVLGAAAECRSLESVIVRSGIEVYGRRRGSITRPDERAPVDPTSDYGRMVADIEATAGAIGRRVGVAVGAVRLASVLGPHVPSPLGRYLRLPAVPFSALADPAVRGDPQVRRSRGDRGCRPRAAGRAGQRGGARRDHHAPGHPARPAHPRARARSRMGCRRAHRLRGRLARARPPARAAAPGAASPTRPGPASCSASRRRSPPAR